MADLKRAGMNNQRRNISVAIADLVEADILGAGSTYMTLPENTVVVGVGILVTTASGTTGATLDVDYNGSEIGSEIAVTTRGMIADTVTATNAFSDTGGDIVVSAGAVTPADGAFAGKLIVEYIELNKVTGEYTN